MCIHTRTTHIIYMEGIKSMYNNILYLYKPMIAYTCTYFLNNIVLNNIIIILYYNVYRLVLNRL